MTIQVLYHNKTLESIYNEKMDGDFGQGIGKAEGILANQKRLNYKLSECNLLKHIPLSGTVLVPFATTPNEAPLPSSLRGWGVDPPFASNFLAFKKKR